MRSERLHQAIAHRMQVVFDGVAIVMVENESFGANSWSLHLLSSAACDEKEYVAWPVETRQRQPAISKFEKLLWLFGPGFAPCSARQKRGQKFFPVLHVGQRNRVRALGRGNRQHAQHPRGLRHRNAQPAVRPTAAKGQIKAQPKLSRSLGSKAECFQVFVREKGIVAKTDGGVVQRERIGRLNFHSADPAGFHESQLALQLVLGYGGTEPPPAHQDAAIVGRILKGLSEMSYGVWCALSLRSELRTQDRKSK